MRIVSETTLRSWAGQWPDAAPWLGAWLKAAGHANWESLTDLRATYPAADGVKVRSGKTVTVFNVAGNTYRMITAIHYNRGIVFLLALLPHPEYSKGRWKDRL